MQIQIEPQISLARQAELGISNWPIWEKEVSTFPWTYGDQETCFILAGEVTITPQGGAAVTLRPGDLAILPQGMHCTWAIHQPLRKHYQFGSLRV